MGVQSDLVKRNITGIKTLVLGGAYDLGLYAPCPLARIISIENCAGTQFFSHDAVSPVVLWSCSRGNTWLGHLVYVLFEAIAEQLFQDVIPNDFGLLTGFMAIGDLENRFW
jgi:hypothetical protein